MNSELEILKSIAGGDERAFSILFERYSDKVYNTAISYTKNAEEAKEVTQDVFIKIHKNAASFLGKSSLSTWIYRIVVNTSLNHIKKNNVKIVDNPNTVSFAELLMNQLSQPIGGGN